VLNEIVSEAYAAEVAAGISDQDQQLAAMQYIAKNQPANRTQAAMIVEQIIEAGFETGTQDSLFGEEFFAETLIAERAKVLDQSIRQLRRMTKAFKTTLLNEGVLKEAGNILAIEANQEVVSHNETLIEVVRRLANRKGPISSALDDAARTLKGNGNPAAAVRQFLDVLERVDAQEIVRSGAESFDGRPGQDSVEAASGDRANSEGADGGRDNIRGENGQPSETVVDDKTADIFGNPAPVDPPAPVADAVAAVSDPAPIVEQDPNEDKPDQAESVDLVTKIFFGTATDAEKARALEIGVAEEGRRGEAVLSAEGVKVRRENNIQSSGLESSVVTPTDSNSSQIGVNNAQDSALNITSNSLETLNNWKKSVPVLGTVRGWYVFNDTIGGSVVLMSDEKLVKGFQSEVDARAWAGANPLKGKPVAQEPATGPKQVSGDGALDQVTKRAQRLQDAAEKAIARETEKLEQDRLENTPKRQRQAEGARSEARKALARAEVASRVADLQREGLSGPLSTLSTLPQMDQIFLAWRRAQIARERAENLGYDPNRRKSDADINFAIIPRRYNNNDIPPARIKEINAEVDKERDKLAKAGINSDKDLQAALELVSSLLSGSKIGPDPIKQAEQQIKFLKIPGFFQTPESLAARVVDEAGIEPGMSVLEPGAGGGRIADAVRNAVPDAEITVLEISGQLQEVLKLKGFDIAGTDFTEFTGGPYDRIVMNPPFERNQDIDHVMRAYEMLKPGGRLVSIMGRGAFFRGGRKESEFRDFLEQMGAVIEELPDGSFKESGTGVATNLIVLDKPSQSFEASVDTSLGPAQQSVIPGAERVPMTLDEVMALKPTDMVIVGPIKAPYTEDSDQLKGQAAEGTMIRIDRANGRFLEGKDQNGRRAAVDTNNREVFKMTSGQGRTDPGAKEGGLFDTESQKQKSMFQGPIDGEKAGFTINRMMQGQMGRSLDDTYAVAPALQDELNAFILEAAQSLSVEGKTAEIKARDKAEEKIIRKEYDDASRLTDIVRGGFIVETVEDAEPVAQAILDRFPGLDESWGVSEALYADRKVLVQFPDGTIGELQIWTRAMLEAKDTEGHTIYEQYRQLKDSDPLKAQLLEEQRAIYSAAAIASGPSMEGILSTSIFGNVFENVSRDMTRPDSSTSSVLTARQSSDLGNEAIATDERSANTTAGLNSQETQYKTSFIDQSSNPNVSDVGETINAEPTQQDVDVLSKAISDDLGLRSLSMFLSNGDLKVNMIAVKKEDMGSGKGSSAMERITSYADQNGLRIKLSPGLKDDGFGTTSRSRLVKFYKRFGFVENKGRAKDFSISESMYRNPVKSIHNRGTFDGADPRILNQQQRIPGVDGKPEKADPNRGSITLERGRTTIQLFKAADASTFLHESGHLWLELLMDLGSLQDAPQQLQDDLSTVLGYLGVSKVSEIGVDQHEKWARTVEAFVMEGKSPSLELTEVFAHFSAWLRRIYRSITGLDVEMTPEVRAVIGRMMATPDAIARAESQMSYLPAFKDEAAAGMTQSEFQDYLRTAERARSEAEQELLGRLMNEIRREKTAAWNEEKAKVEKEVSDRVNQNTTYQAIEYLTKGEFPIGTPAEGAMKLNGDILEAQWGKDVMNSLPRNGIGRVYKRNGGAHPDVIAPMFGFADGEALIQAMLNVKQTRREEITAEVDRIMKERHGDILNDGSIESQAVEVLHSDQRALFLTLELKALNRRVGRGEPSATAVAREAAKAAIERKKISEAVRSGQYRIAESKAGREFTKAIIKEDYQTAADAKRRQLMNFHLYTAARQLSEEVDKLVSYMKKISKASVREKIHVDYRDQIDALLEQYDMRSGVTQKALGKRESLREFITRQESDGEPINIPQSVIDQANKTHYKDMVAQDFRDLVDAVKNLKHLGRLKTQLIINKEKRDLQEVADGVTDSIYTAKPVQAQGATETVKQAAGRRKDNLTSLILSPTTLLREMDGWVDLGAAFQAIKGGIDMAMSRGVVPRMRKMERDISDLYSRFYKPYEMKGFADKLRIAGVSQRFTKEQILAIALNSGNEYNKAVLEDSKRFQDGEIDILLSTLSERDWQFVQATWDYINTYWDDIAAAERRRTGIVPQKVEAAKLTVQTADGKTLELEGGYYPVKYDANLSMMVKEETAEDML
jgi:protein-L-isoaspartate O-methyltransferase